MMNQYIYIFQNGYNIRLVNTSITHITSFFSFFLFCSEDILDLFSYQFSSTQLGVINYRHCAALTHLPPGSLCPVPTTPPPNPPP